MLGAYQPREQLTTLLVVAIKDLRDNVLAVDTPGATPDLRPVFTQWVNTYGNMIVRTMIDDFNSKYTERGLPAQRGVVPYVNPISVEEKITIEGEKKQGWGGAYSAKNNTIKISFNKFERNYSLGKVLKVTGIANKKKFSAQYATALTVGTIIHETLHHIQLFDTREMSMMKFAFERPEFFMDNKLIPYSYRTVELAAHSIGLALKFAVMLPRKYYWIHDSVKIMESFRKLTENDEPKGLYYAFATKDEALMLGFKSDYASEVKKMRDAFGDDRINELVAVVGPSVLGKPFDEAVKFGYKNLMRYIRKFDSINVAFEQDNLKLYKD